MAEYIEHEEQFPIIKESEYYFSINTEHFYFDVYKAWNSCTNRKQEMFRASVNVKKGDRKYLIEYSLFAEWDYQDKQTAFAESKKWVLEYAQRLCKELKLTPAADVVEVVRCGLCKNYALDREKGGFCKRSASPSMWRDDITPLRPDDFCSYGERRVSI